MKLQFKPHIFALVGSAVILAASGMLLVKSQSSVAASSPPAPVAQSTTPAPVAAPAAPVAGTAAPLTNAPTFTTAQIDQWVAPIALFPDPLLSQVLMASTYPANVVQAVQWSRDNPKQQGDPAVQAVSNQPWDPSVKSLVAFPQLLALMGENPPWVQNLGDAFLGQPKDVMDSVQKLRLMAQQTGTLKTTPQQTVTTAPVTVNQNTTVAEPSSTSAAPAPAPTVIKIEPTNPEVVYVPSYNPTTAYGTWPNTAYPPVYLPPPEEDDFGDNYMDGLGFGLGIVTTAALFGSIDWDDDDYDGYHGGGGGYNRNGDNNINIDVDRYNRVSGQNLARGTNTRFQHNPTYRNGVGYQSNAVSERYNRTNTAGGLSTTPNAASVNRDAQRQAAKTQMQQTQRQSGTTAQRSTRDAQRQASSQQLNKVAQRNNYRGYDTPNTDARRNAAKTQANRSTTQQTQRRQEAARTQPREQNRATTTTKPRQQQTQRQTRSALSGNESRSPSWQAQNQRGQQSLNRSSANREQRSGGRERSSGQREVNRR